MVVGLEIQYGGQNIILFILSCHCSKICQKDCPHQNIFKLTLSQKSFYVFRKDRQCKFIFFIEPKFRPDKHHLCTGSRSWCTLLAASSYLQPCLSTLLYTVPVILTVQFLSLAKMKTTASGVKCLLNLLY